MTDKPTSAPKARTSAARASGDAPVVMGTASAIDTSGPADIAAAKDFSPSGAPRQVTDIDVDHPAIDNYPRADTTVDQNRIDMNDPTIEGREAVEKNLGDQGK